MKKAIAPIVILLCLTLAILACVLPVLASTTDNATYVATVRVTNNNTSEVLAFVPFTLDTQTLINQHYVVDNLTNSALLTNGGADTAYGPAYSGSDNWSVYVPAVAALSQQDYKLYLGGTTAMGGKKRYFAGEDGMVTVDVPGLEVGDNGTIGLSGYFDTTQTWDAIITKTKAFRMDVNYTSGNVTASIYDTNGIEVLYNDAASQYANKAAGCVTLADNNTFSIDAWFEADAIGLDQTVTAFGDGAGTKVIIFRAVAGTDKLLVYALDGAAGAAAINFTSTNAIAANTRYLATVSYDESTDYHYQSAKHYQFRCCHLKPQ